MAPSTISICEVLRVSPKCCLFLLSCVLGVGWVQAGMATWHRSRLILRQGCGLKTIKVLGGISSYGTRSVLPFTSLAPPSQRKKEQNVLEISETQLARTFWWSGQWGPRAWAGVSWTDCWRLGKDLGTMMRVRTVTPTSPSSFTLSSCLKLGTERTGAQLKGPRPELQLQ